jgi:branched-subunit amino acid ABC-type transport system permease component
MVAFIQNCVDALSLGSLYALAALGIGLLFGMLRLINFAHGNFITIGAFGLIVPSRNDMAIMAIGSLPVVLLVPAACAIVVIAALLSRVETRYRTATPSYGPSSAGHATPFSANPPAVHRRIRATRTSSRPVPR